MLTPGAYQTKTNPHLDFVLFSTLTTYSFASHSLSLRLLIADIAYHSAAVIVNLNTRTYNF